MRRSGKQHSMVSSVPAGLLFADTRSDASPSSFGFEISMRCLALPAPCHDCQQAVRSGSCRTRARAGDGLTMSIERSSRLAFEGLNPAGLCWACRGRWFV
jgi:hypothetical protein